MEAQQLGLTGDEALGNIAIGTDSLKRQDPVNEYPIIMTMEYADTEGNETSIEHGNTSKFL